MAIAIILPTAAAVGLALLLWGWRGRRVGEHMHCTACGFDLFGLPARAPACPECGGDLLAVGGTARGERRRRAVPLVLGLMLLAVAGSLGGLAAWRHASKSTFYSYAPTAYLLWVVDDPDARHVLRARISRGEVGADTVADLVDHALDVQADPARPWDDEWGGIIEGAYAAGRVSQEQLARYAAGAATLELKVRPKVQVGREPDAYISVSAAKRIGPQTRVEITVALHEFWINGVATGFHSSLRREAAKFEFDNGSFSGSMSHLPMKSLGRRLGPVSIEAEVEHSVRIAFRGQPLTPPITLPPQRLAARFEVVKGLTGHYPDGEVSAAHQQANAAVWISDQLSHIKGRALVFKVIHQSYRLRAKCYLRIRGEIVPLGFGGGGTGGSSGDQYRYFAWSFDKLFKRHPHLIGETRADLIVRADIDDAETDASARPTWPGEWVFLDVPLDAAGIAKPPGNYDSRTPLPTLVPAHARRLTPQEAEQPPPAKRPARPRGVPPEQSAAAP